jgi:HD-GYP domain-containing protein (c-di-GMP phosphodiesterase class II)
MSDEYTPLRISTIKPGKEINFDLYIFFKERFLKYLDRGGALDDDKILKLKKQKMARFFITEEDEINYQNFLDEVLDEAMNSETMEVGEKVKLAEGSCETALDRMQKDPESEKSFNMAEKAAKSLKTIVTKNPDALAAIFGKKTGKDDMIVKHSLNVSALSAKLAETEGVEESDIDALVTAALIHDLGLTKFSETDMALFFKPKKDFTPDDHLIYNKHCKVAEDLLTDKPYITKEIKELIFNHEETLSGSGPQKKTKLNKLEEIISLVDNYDKRMITEEITAKQAIKDIQIDELGNYDLALITNFKKVLEKEGLLKLE